ncbi:hypothetical protein EI74_0277 [Mycoplasma testudineum]|uniref:Uncharacterized protein n=1 Tax=Mycoplasma testudineum TaxID=244584 RepID=A0A4R6IDV4_9MOLU|nr:hypothetical protein [Mycoplasma testudineum]OYD26902.1 hypothetical protein CG473_01000 [Mycoplasma testudineum]TDO20450.1 hypothetical protein EI74_0277 [Mycoplasma testudineum]
MHKEVEIPKYTIKENGQIWTIDFETNRNFYDSLIKLLKNQIETIEKLKGRDPQRELIDRVVGQFWNKIEAEFINKKFILIRNDLEFFELLDDKFIFQLKLFFFKKPNLELVKKYEPIYDFTYLSDFKISKNLEQRNTLIVGQELEEIEIPKAPNYIDKIGRICKVKLTFISKNQKSSEQIVEKFIVGLGLVANDEYKIMKKAKVGDSFDFKMRQIHYGWNENDNLFNPDALIKLEILEITNKYWRSNVKDLWQEESIKKIYKSKESLELLITKLSRFELMIFKNYSYVFEFVKWMMESDIFKIDKHVESEMKLKYVGVFDQIQKDKNLHDKLKPELQNINSLETFIEKSFEVEVNPLKISSFIDDTIEDNNEHKELYETVAKNLIVYLKYHKEIMGDEQILISTYMNFITLIKLAQLQNPAIIPNIKSQMKEQITTGNFS